MITSQATEKDALYQQRLKDIQPYNEWAKANPLQASEITADQYMNIRHDQIVKDVYGDNRDPRTFTWLGEGTLPADPKAPWYGMATLPGGYGAYPTNPTTQKVLSGTIGVIAVGALIAWGAELVSGKRPNDVPAPTAKQ
jgi:hypothetical protein